MVLVAISNSRLQIYADFLFANRGTRPDAEHVVFSDEFAQNEVRQKMWKSYLKKIKYKDELPFNEVMSVIKERLQGMMG